MNDAEKCRRNGWTIGTILEGTESGEGWSNTDVIQITSVGLRNILARQKLDDRWDCERHWTLECRDWKKIGWEQPRVFAG